MHDFDHCLYSLLNDELLPDPDNLLIDINYDSKQHSNGKKTQVINDIDSGTAYKKACETYINTTSSPL
jgi:hypothetical protein